MYLRDICTDQRRFGPDIVEGSLDKLMMMRKLVTDRNLKILILICKDTLGLL